jgi:phosphoserine phosphatase RsbU/P
MDLNIFRIKLDKDAGPVRRALQYAFYDWEKDMSRRRRMLTRIGFVVQLLALVLAMVGPRRAPFMFMVIVIYMVGLCLVNGLLTSEFIRKTQLEADQTAAEQIQKTLHPQNVEKLPGYELEMFYKPVRGVGGDYYDIIQLASGRTLFVIADVSGKGMPAALLAANIQALVRSISCITSDLGSLADQVNNHFCQYTPPERFATAVFASLSRETGEFAYVNAGHNPPILSSADGVTFLDSTGMPLGLVREAKFDCKTSVIPPGGKLLFFTDGLTDGIGGDAPEERISAVIRDEPGPVISKLTSLVDPKFNEDDITILLITRHLGAAPRFL